MGSGYWPIKKGCEEGKKLSQAISLAQEVNDQVGYDDNQFDNAYLDGRYKESLSIAITLMKDCLRE